MPKKEKLMAEEKLELVQRLERGARDREIKAWFDGGNYRALALQFRLSERQIWKIINSGRN